MKRVLFTLSVVFALIAGPAAVAKPGKMGGGGGDHVAEKVMKSLNLSEEQQKQIKEIREKNKEAMQGAREKRKEAFKALQELLQNSDAEDGAIRDAHQKLQSIKSDASNMQFEQLMAIRKVLTPEQRGKFRTLLMEKFGEKRGKMRRHHQGEESEG